MSESPGVRKISVVIPVYNEAAPVRELVGRVVRAPLASGLDREILCVDDGSGAILDARPAACARPHGRTFEEGK